MVGQQIRQLTRWFLASCAVLLITVYALGDMRAEQPSGVTSISAPNDGTIDVTLWEPPYRKFEVVALPSNQTWPTGRNVRGEMLVRPAWGMFAAIVAIFLCCWTNVEHSGSMVVELIQGLH